MKSIEKCFYLLVMGFLIMPNTSTGDETIVGENEVINKLKSEVEDLKQQLTVLMTQVSQTEHAAQRLSDQKPRPGYSVNSWMGGFNIPVGSIIPWMPGNQLPNEELDEETNLPRGFLACNGPHDVDNPKTEFDERKIPNLIAGSLFAGKEGDRLIMIIKAR